MTRPLAVVSILLAAGLLAACGGKSEADRKDDFKKDFNALNDRLLTLGDEVGKSLQNARGKTDEQIETEFGGYSTRLDEITEDYEKLEAPDDMKREYDAMKTELGKVNDDLAALVAAVKGRRTDAIREATAKFVIDSRSLRDARRALARKTGGQVGR